MGNSEYEIGNGILKFRHTDRNRNTISLERGYDRNTRLPKCFTTPISCTFIFNLKVKNVMGQPYFKPLSSFVIGERQTC